MPNFNVGDRAIVISNPPEWEAGMTDLIGEIVTITEPLQMMHNQVSGRPALVYPTDAVPNCPYTIVAFEPCNLKPIDGDNDVSWEQVEKITGWKPREVVHVETS